MPEQTTIVNVLPATPKRSYQHLIAAAIASLGALIQGLQQVWPDLVKTYPTATKAGPFVMLAGFLYTVYLRQREPAKAQPVDLSPQGQAAVQETKP